MKQILIALLILFISAGCKKETDQQNTDSANLNVDFNNAPVDTIKAYINGKWFLDHKEGGFIGGKEETPNSYFEFSFNPDSIQRTFNGISETRKPIKWTKIDMGYDSKSYYMMSPDAYLVRGVYNDTLILTQYGVSDGYTYHLVRQ